MGGWRGSSPCIDLPRDRQLRTTLCPSMPDLHHSLSLWPPTDLDSSEHPRTGCVQLKVTHKSSKGDA